MSTSTLPKKVIQFFPISKINLASGDPDQRSQIFFLSINVNSNIFKVPHELLQQEEFNQLDLQNGKPDD